MNTGPNGCLCSKKEIESFETHSCESDGHIAGIFKMISMPSPNSIRKKNELEVRRPSDEENFCPSEYSEQQISNKKQSKLKNSVSNESGKTKRMKFTEEELPQKVSLSLFYKIIISIVLGSFINISNKIAYYRSQ